MSEGCGGCGGSGVDRRSFLSTSAVVVLGSFLAAACGDGEVGGSGLPTSPPGGIDALLIRIADFPALATVGGIARVDAGGSSPVAVTRTGASTFVAMTMICPHAAFRPIQITASGFRCPNHGAEFGPNGTWAGGQPTTDLPRFAVEYDAAAGTLRIS